MLGSPVAGCGYHVPTGHLDWGASVVGGGCFAPVAVGGLLRAAPWERPFGPDVLATDKGGERTLTATRIEGRLPFSAVVSALAAVLLIADAASQSG